MTIVGISITKETTFRDSVQPFSNMYFYNNGLGGTPDQTGANAMLDELVALEKTFHSTAVEFVFGRIWLQALTQIGSVMLHQKQLSGQGATTTIPTMDKERAFLLRRRAGQDERGQPVYLRKYYHSCGELVGGANHVSSAILQNVSGFSQANRDAQANAVNSISDLAAGGGGWEICSKGGRAPTQPGWQAHQYLEHHQMGDMWRGA